MLVHVCETAETFTTSARFSALRHCCINCRGGPPWPPECLNKRYFVKRAATAGRPTVVIEDLIHSSMVLATSWSNRDLNLKETDDEKSFSRNHNDRVLVAGGGAITNSARC